jgi:hypothetical protein
VPHRATRQVLWPDQKGPFEITLDFRPLEGRMECVRFEVRLLWWDRPRPVTASLVRSIPLAKLIDRERSTFAPQRWEWPSDPAWAAADRRLWVARKRPKGGGRPPKYDVNHYVEVVRIYGEAYARNRTSTRAVAAHFRVSETAAAKWVAKARKLGLLLPTTRGKARAVEPAKRTTARRKKR